MKYKILVTMAKTEASNDSGCSGGSCPTFYQSENGKVYVQGTKISTAKKRILQFPIQRI
jgi:hypothetical protein